MTAAAAVAAGMAGFVVGAAVGVASRPQTQTDLIIATLKASADVWVESSSVLHDDILRIHGVDIKSNSLLPLLTGLKNEGIIVRDGPKIALAERAAVAKTLDWSTLEPPSRWAGGGGE